MLTRVKLTKLIEPKLKPKVVLSREQQAAVDDTAGVRIIAACPGGGKTKTLIQSVSNLVNNLDESPAKILAFTFTKQAAEEMRDRLEEELGPTKAGRLECCTMHSFFYRIFRDQCHVFPSWDASEVTLIDKAPGGKKKLYREVARELNLSEIDIDFGQYTRKICFWKNWNVSPDEALAEASFDEMPLAIFYQAYEAKKTKDKIIDFEDMLLHPLHLFEQYPEIAKEYSSLYEHIFVDEYHDTSPVQNDLIKHLYTVHGNLFLVCDPNQSIYGFRGANPDVVIEYRSHFPGAKLLKLSRNFRSRTRIVDCCYKLIGHNEDSEALGLTAESQKFGGVVEYAGSFANEEAEAEAVIKLIKCSKDSQAGLWADHTILYRMNAQSRALEDQLVKEQIPYQIIGSSSFYHRKEVLDLLSYLKFLDAPEPLGEAFERIYNRPNRYLGRAWYRQYIAFATSDRPLNQLLQAEYSHGYMRRGALKLRVQLGACQNEYQRFVDGEINLSELATFILKTVGYLTWLKKDDEQNQERVDGLEEFVHSLEKFITIDSFFKYIELIQSKISDDKKEQDLLTMMTVHKSKGTEHKNIYVVGVNEGVLPHELASTVYEERRICFVAVSRAEEECWLHSTDTFRGKSSSPSRFLTEMGLIPSTDVKKE